MKITIETNELASFLEPPSKDGRKYYIWTPDWGLYSEKEAWLIVSFLRKNLAEIIRKAEKSG